MAELKITITTEGVTTIAVEGVKGESCRDLTRNIERALGTVSHDEVTGEMCEVEVTNEASNRN